MIQCVEVSSVGELVQRAAEQRSQYSTNVEPARTAVR